MKCSECVYSQKSDKDLNAYNCLCNPPVMHIIPSPNGLIVNTMFPVVAADMFCYKHEAKPSLIA